MTITDVADKTIALKIAPSQASVGAGVAVLRSLPTPALEAVGPFVFLDQFVRASRRQKACRRIRTPGIEVISYDRPARTITAISSATRARSRPAALNGSVRGAACFTRKYCAAAPMG